MGNGMTEECRESSIVVRGFPGNHLRIERNDVISVDDLWLSIRSLHQYGLVSDELRMVPDHR